jgi:hypothetical protein
MCQPSPLSPLSLYLWFGFNTRRPSAPLCLSSSSLLFLLFLPHTVSCTHSRTLSSLDLCHVPSCLHGSPSSHPQLSAVRRASFPASPALAPALGFCPCISYRALAFFPLFACALSSSGLSPMSSSFVRFFPLFSFCVSCRPPLRCSHFVALHYEPPTTSITLFLIFLLIC